MVDDPDAAVRYQLALGLGEWAGPEAGRALGYIAVRYGADRWIRAAVLSSSSHHAASVLEEVLASSCPSGPSPMLIEPLIATLAAARDGAAIARALAAIGGNKEPAGGRAVWRIGAAAQILDAAADEALTSHPAIRSVVVAARDLAGDESAAPGDRATALRLLGRVRAELDADRRRIAARLDPGEAVEIQLAAVRALTRMGDLPSAEVIVDRWRQLGPSVRAAALSALLERRHSTEALLSALEKGRIAVSDVDAFHRDRLLRNGSEESRGRAARALGAVGIGQRQAVLAAYAKARTIAGDPQRGKRTFERACAPCHRLDGVGHEVGPDLAALTDVSADAIVTAVLDPNREVDARYATYTAALKDGRVLSGMIAAETASAITLKRQEGQSDVILRADLQEMTTGGRSLMPEGLENDLKPTDIADLIAFVVGGTGRPKELDGNRPRTVVQDADGAIPLTATAAEVYGPSLIYEPEFGNLGYWHQPRDRAAWRFRVDRPGTFTMSLEWACDDGSAGNRYAIHVDDSITHGVIAGTGSWAAYRSIFFREVTLSAGLHRLDLRPDGPIRGALADVRAIVLTPRGAVTSGDAAGRPRAGESADPLAAMVLDPSTPSSRRDAILKARAVPPAALVAALARGLGDPREEYRRIPWIWQIAIAAGRRDDDVELRGLLDVALPRMDAPLSHWRAVVLGGGIINGISQSGSWPGDRIEGLVLEDRDLLARWRRALDLASTMADDDGVPKGTRYDALRMIGLASWDGSGPQLVRYLADGIDPELQQGAIGALGDMRSPQAAQAILTGLARYTAPNRKLAIEALVRDDDRRVLLLDALEAGHVAAAELGEEAIRRLVDPARNRSHERARRLLSR